MKTETNTTIKRYKNTDYFVTNDGRVFSKKNYRGTNLTELKQRDGVNGYKEVSIRHKGKRLTLYVHRMVLETFDQRTEEEIKSKGLEVCHLDHNTSNNHISNLKWGNRSENMKMNDKDWTRNKPRYKEELKYRIKKLNENGQSMKSLSDTFGISYTSIYRWCNTVTY